MAASPAPGGVPVGGVPAGGFPVGGVRPAQRLTLTDDVYESLKNMIMEHAVAPGERVGIDGLARALRVSPTPVREALARLESDGLVRKRPMSGYTTTPLLTRDEFDELFEMRLLLEPAAADRAARHAREAERTRIAHEAAATVKIATGDGYRRHAAFTALDARFHDTVAQVCRNALLRDVILRLHSHLHLHRLYFPPDGAEATRCEHRAIAAAIANRDADGAARAMRRHLMAARERHLPAFDQPAP